MQQRPQTPVSGHPQGTIMPVAPVDQGLKREAGMKAGGTWVTIDMAFRRSGSLCYGLELCRQESEVVHGRSKFPTEGAGLEGGEEGVQLIEVSALAGLLLLDGADNGGEVLLEAYRRARPRRTADDCL